MARKGSVEHVKECMGSLEWQQSSTCCAAHQCVHASMSPLLNLLGMALTSAAPAGRDVVIA